MSVKIIKCKTCDGEIASNAKICPKCGAKNKRPFYKRWWFWCLIVLAILIVAVSGGDDGSAETTGETTSAQSSETAKSENSAAEAYQYIAENSDPTFTVPEKAIAFINEHPNFFPGKSDIKGAISDYVDENITYAHLAKNISKYSDKLISVYGSVSDIEEAEDGSLTYIHIVDYESNSYTLYYLGTLDDVFEGTEIHGYALPFAMTTFENMAAQYTEAVTGAACYIEALG